MLDALNREAFANHLHSAFAIQAGEPEGPPTAVMLELVEATDGRHHAPEKGRESFSLMFRGSRDVPLVPRHAANFGVSWRLMPRTQLHTILRYVGERPYDADETNRFGRRKIGCEGC